MASIFLAHLEFKKILFFCLKAKLFFCICWTEPRNCRKKRAAVCCRYSRTLHHPRLLAVVITPHESSTKLLFVFLRVSSVCPSAGAVQRCAPRRWSASSLLLPQSWRSSRVSELSVCVSAGRAEPSQGESQFAASAQHRSNSVFGFFFWFVFFYQASY